MGIFFQSTHAEDISQLRDKYTQLDDLETSYRYTNYAAGYSFIYPKTWKIEYHPNDIGIVNIRSQNDPNTSILFWYKDSNMIKDINELFNYVLDDAKWEEENYGTKTISMEKGFLYDKEAIIWFSTGASDNPDLYSKQYYISKYGNGSSNIWIRVITIQTLEKESPNSKDEVEKILSSYKIL